MEKKDSEPRARRSFLGILFKCCNTYGRIYRNEQATAYVGHCPVCGKRVFVPIGKDGTSARFFVAE
ncbi:MAG: hypothetical protein GF410_08955 [Chitinivibrionales bacterium]|nr:hypothetical protein [Chitinivibrionales bacterium]